MLETTNISPKPSPGLSPTVPPELSPKDPPKSSPELSSELSPERSTELSPKLSIDKMMSQMETTSGRRRRIAWIAGIILLLLLVALTMVWSVGGKDSPMRYETQPVRRGNLVITVTATGNLEATNQVEVGSELSGTITRMTADYNDNVTLGQPLAYIDDAKYSAAVMKSESEVAAARADHQEAVATQKAAEKKVRRYRMTRELTNGKLPSLEDLEAAEADLERSIAKVQSTAAAIESALANLRSNQTDLKRTVIYAPINGIVLSRDVEPGQTVAASLAAPVLYVLAEDLHHMELQVDVDEADVGQVMEGQPATFTVDAYPERTFEAQITQVRYGAETTDGVVTYKTVLRVENPDLLLRPGMTATADIIVKKVENTLLVPNAALRFSPPAAAAGGRRNQSLLDSLLPRPPHRQASKKGSGGATPDAGKMQAGVWILDKGRPVLIAVEKIATDSALTAVKSTQLQEGRELVVNAITTN